MSIDLEICELNNEKYIECIICFEDIKEPPQKYKYMCNHRDNMHEECIKNLDICPICRSISKYLYEAQFNDVDEYYEYIHNHRNHDVIENQSRCKCTIIKEFLCVSTLIIIVFIISYFS
tara:strand:+ start:3483 stop:3839 length:357 start_codon:yes stop_codon:yes gene_type:complete